MSLPNEASFAVIKLGDGATTEVFTIACGIADINLNQIANTTDRFVRDCAKPGEIPNRNVKVTGKQADITASGLTDKASVAIFAAALGKAKNYKVELLQDNGTDAGLLLGTYAGNFVMTAFNSALPRDGDSTVELTLASNGAWTWVSAP
jgi:predicted secreted protein